MGWFKKILTGGGIASLIKKVIDEQGLKPGVTPEQAQNFPKMPGPEMDLPPQAFGRPAPPPPPVYDVKDQESLQSIADQARAYAQQQDEYRTQGQNYTDAVNKWNQGFQNIAYQGPQLPIAAPEMPQGIASLMSQSIDPALTGGNMNVGQYLQNQGLGYTPTPQMTLPELQNQGQASYVRPTRFAMQDVVQNAVNAPVQSASPFRRR